MFADTGKPTVGLRFRGGADGQWSTPYALGLDSGSNSGGLWASGPDDIWFGGGAAFSHFNGEVWSPAGDSGTGSPTITGFHKTPSGAFFAGTWAGPLRLVGTTWQRESHPKFFPPMEDIRWNGFAGSGDALWLNGQVAADGAQKRLISRQGEGAAWVLEETADAGNLTLHVDGRGRLFGGGFNGVLVLVNQQPRRVLALGSTVAVSRIRSVGRDDVYAFHGKNENFLMHGRP